MVFQFKGQSQNEDNSSCEWHKAQKWWTALDHLSIYYFPQGGEGCSSAEDPRPLQLKSEWRSAVSGIRKVFWSYFRVQDFHCHLCILTHLKWLSGFDCFFLRFQSWLFWSKTWICTTGGYTVAQIILSEELNMGDYTVLLSILQPLWRGRHHDVDQVLLQVRGWSSQDVEPQDVQTHWKGARSSSSQCCQDFHQLLILNMNLIVATSSAWTFWPRWFPISPPRSSPQTTSAGPPRSRLSVLFYKESGTIAIFQY